MVNDCQHGHFVINFDNYNMVQYDFKIVQFTTRKP